MIKHYRQAQAYRTPAWRYSASAAEIERFILFLLFKRAARAFICSQESITRAGSRGWRAMLCVASSSVVEDSVGSAEVAFAGFGGGETVSGGKEVSCSCVGGTSLSSIQVRRQMKRGAYLLNRFRRSCSSFSCCQRLALRCNRFLELGIRLRPFGEPDPPSHEVIQSLLQHFGSERSLKTVCVRKLIAGDLGPVQGNGGVIAG